MRCVHLVHHCRFDISAVARAVTRETRSHDRKGQSVERLFSLVRGENTGRHCGHLFRQMGSLQAVGIFRIHGNASPTSRFSSPRRGLSARRARARRCDPAGIGCGRPRRAVSGPADAGRGPRGCGAGRRSFACGPWHRRQCCAWSRVFWKRSAGHSFCAVSRCQALRARKTGASRWS